MPVYRNDDPPTDQEYPCLVCGKWVDDCICPECQECGCQGDPSCYGDHGLVRSEDQIQSLASAEALWEQQNRDDALAEQHTFEHQNNESPDR